MLNEALLAGHSATMVLDAWCAHHGMAAPNGVSIQKISSGTVEKIPAHVRKALAIPRGADIMHRRVRLLCGGHILSEADNWYVPARIPPVMRETLTTTDVSFGRVLAPLNFTRKPLTLKMLATAKLISKAASQGHGFDLFAHNALLSLPDGQPLAYVQETYKSGALEFVDGADTLSH